MHITTHLLSVLLAALWEYMERQRMSGKTGA
jgi:hypothetical protein